MAVRKSAEERREEILAVGIRHFAAGGYHGTSTEAIAREAGISQPYLFRLFRTKRELFLACVDRSNERILDVFRRVAAEAPAGRAAAPDGQGLRRRAAARPARDPDADAGVRRDDRPRDPGARARVLPATSSPRSTELSGAEPEEVWNFFSHGMLLNVTAALDLASITGEDAWAAAFLQAGAGAED